MTLQQLLYVLTVSDEKTMNKAAEKTFCVTTNFNVCHSIA